MLKERPTGSGDRRSRGKSPAWPDAAQFRTDRATNDGSADGASGCAAPPAARQPVGAKSPVGSTPDPRSARQKTSNELMCRMASMLDGQWPSDSDRLTLVSAAHGRSIPLPSSLSRLVAAMLSRSRPSDTRDATGGATADRHSDGDGSESGPTPAQLTPATWNWYGTPGMSLVMMARVSLVRVSSMPVCHVTPSSTDTRTRKPVVAGLTDARSAGDRHSSCTESRPSRTVTSP
mmetsp:Transcript_10025/g.33115  ORF Transcript_10025/g.33115 Transcript_10025/m.33115 type:complete len:233 (+) Transcript_10025:827-1525(+)